MSAREDLRANLHDRRRYERRAGFDRTSLGDDLEDDSIGRWAREHYPSAASVHLFVEATIFTRGEIVPVSMNRDGWLFHLPPLDDEGRSLLHSCSECSDAIDVTLDEEDLRESFEIDYPGRDLEPAWPAPKKIRRGDWPCLPADLIGPARGERGYSWL